MKIAPKPAGGQWAHRRVVAWGLRGAVRLAPILASVAAAWAARRGLARPANAGAAVLWWLTMLAIGFGAGAVAGRATRRLLPLAMLFRLTLAFPDAAPSRFSVALRRGNAKALQSRPGTAGHLAGELVRQVAALHAHDRRTRGHSERVRAYSHLLGEELGLGAHDLQKLQWAALVHDVGKLDVPVAILNKAGKLDDHEFAQIKGHPDAARHRLEGLRPWLGEWADAAAEHHERWDGSGYPLGLAGEEISRGGRIVAVADAYDVMTSVRSYKRGMPAPTARQELMRCAGSHFDPVMVRAFLNVSLARPSIWQRLVGVAAQLPVLGAAGGSVVSAAVTGAATAVVGVSVGMFEPNVEAIAAPVELAPALAVRADPTTSTLDRADDSQGRSSPGGADPTVGAAPITTVITVVDSTATVVPIVTTTLLPRPVTTTTTNPKNTTTTQSPPFETTPPGPTTTTTTAPPSWPWPEANPDAVSTKAGQAVLIEVLQNDKDPYGLGLVVIDPGEPKQGGTATTVRSVVIRYTPRIGFVGTDTFSYILRDALGRTATGVVEVAVVK